MWRTVSNKIKSTLKGFIRNDVSVSLATILKKETVNPTAKVEAYFSFDKITSDFNAVIDANVYFKKYCHLLLYSKSKIEIHNNVFFNNYCSINCLEYIEIGENTIFGEGVKLYDHNHKHHFENEVLYVERNGFTTAPIVIGKNCWIGSNVTILKGVTIGDNVIIGAHNLIYNSIPANTIIKANTSYTTNP